MKQLIGFFFIIILLIACRKEYRVTEESLSVVKCVEHFSDTLFFSKVAKMQTYNDKIYCMDSYQEQIFVLDKNLQLKQVIGKKGEGPDEFKNLSGIFVSQEGIYILDSGNVCLFLYKNTDSLIRVHNFTIDEYFIMPEFRFLLEKDTSFIIAASDTKKAFANFDLKHNVNSFWGERFSFNSDTHNRIRNGRNLLKTKDLFVSVSDNMPVVEIYDICTKRKIKDFDFSEISYVSKQLEYAEVKNHSYYVLIQDAYIDEDKLYMLISEKMNDSFYTNLVLVFALKEKCELTRILRFPGNIYSTLCVNNDTIYAYNSSETKIEILK